MDPDDLGQGYGTEAEGIIVSQVCFDGKGKIRKVFKVLNIPQVDSFLIKFFLVIFYYLRLWCTYNLF